MALVHKTPFDNKSEKTAGSVGVLLLHGLTGMPSEMRPVAKHLLDLGYKVEVPLLPGHGGTHEQILDTTWKDWLSGARNALNELCESCDQVFVGGLSMGASLAVVLAAEDPRVSGIMLLSTTLRYDGKDCPKTRIFLPLADIFPWLARRIWWTEKPPYGLKDERLQKLITKAVEQAKNGENTKFGLFRTYSLSLRYTHHLAKHAMKLARDVRCPALIIHSLEDTLTTMRNATEIYGLLGSEDKSIELLTGCDHVITLDLRKDVVAKKIGEFVTRVAKKVKQKTLSFPAA